MKKFASVANPAINRLVAYNSILVENAVKRFPTNANKFAMTKTCKRPIMSARTPIDKLPITDPIKNTDWPNIGFQSSPQTQFS